MSKVFHPQVASVLQSALKEFRRVSDMTVEDVSARSEGERLLGGLRQGMDSGGFGDFIGYIDRMHIHLKSDIKRVKP